MTVVRTAGSSQLKDSYRRVMDRVAAAAGRSGRRPEDVIVVAVTKTASPDQIRTLVEMGHVDLGENRVQQLVQRTAQLEEYINRKRSLGRAAVAEDELPDQIRWHMIGHLQRNKVKQIIPLVKLIHSVDSLRLAEEIQTFGGRDDRQVEVLLEVNVGGEASKNGIAPPAAQHLAEQIEGMLNLRLRGLMVMAPQVGDADEIRRVFVRSAELFEDVRTSGVYGRTFNILSMGMTNDFEIAIEEGANIVRVGRAIFGDE